jgi:Calcineurin-like phosphoesterase
MKTPRANIPIEGAADDPLPGSGDHRRLLQVVHVTDFHVVASQNEGGGPNGGTIRDWLADVIDKIPESIRNARPIRRFLDDLRQGTASHDVYALEAFREALAGELTPKTWPVTWLLATGDLSGWGDSRSIEYTVRWLKEIADAHGISWAAIYGNHDVWLGDGTLPLPWKVGRPFADQRTRLRDTIFPQTWPLIPVSSDAADAAGASLVCDPAFRAGPAHVLFAEHRRA